MSHAISSELQQLLDASAQSMALFNADYRPINQYIILRMDLQMDAPKMMAQACHASAMALRAARAKDPMLEDLFCGSGNGKKLMMGSKNLYQMEQAYFECQEAGIPCHLVIDRGHVYPPSFDGNPIFTALGIGPVYQDEAARILRRFRLLRASDFAS